jgi:predicted nucleic acid-binding protein
VAGDRIVRDLVDYGELRMCAITRLEILYSARSAEDFETLTVQRTTKAALAERPPGS